MGAHLVAQVLAHWTHLSDRAFRVLVRMAVTALDKPKDGKPANIYHGGRELLAMSLRSEKGSTDTRNRAVKRAVAELSEAGAIQHLRSGWAGQNAVYRLTLGATRAADEDLAEDLADGVDDESEAEEMGGLIDPPMGGLKDPPSGGPVNVNEGGLSGPPKEHEDEILELAEEKSGVALPTTSHPPRVSEADANPDSPPQPKRCPHGLKPKIRTDGQPSCALCRVAANRPAVYRPPPPGEQDLADVIPLDSWRTA